MSTAVVWLLFCCCLVGEYCGCFVKHGHIKGFGDFSSDDHSVLKVERFGRVVEDPVIQIQSVPLAVCVNKCLCVLFLS